MKSIAQRERVKRAKLLGEDGWGVGTLRARIINIRKKYGWMEVKKLHETTRVFTFRVAGRLTHIRVMGKSTFADLLDESGRIQLFVQEDRLGAPLYAAFKKSKLGDIIEACGNLFKTKTGELSIKVDALRILVRAKLPMPDKFHGLADRETRYRQRYLDLIANKQTRANVAARIKMVRWIRRYMDNLGFDEVETPILLARSSGATAAPFKTHHNALGMDLFLRVAPELYLKRLVVGGMEKVFEINRSFRNEGLSPRHNPEFTMLEFYWAYADYEFLMAIVEKLVKSLFRDLARKSVLTWQGQKIDFSESFQIITMLDALHQRCPNSSLKDLTDLVALREIAKQRGVDVKEGFGVGKLQQKLFDKIVEPRLTQPTFITDYPVEVSPLAKSKIDEPHLTERFELFIGGMEIANGFSELNDPDEQALRFQEQIKTEQDEAMSYDEDYITALKYGLPPCAGAGLGVDRLAMLLTNSASIRDVILFPLLKPAPQESAGE